MNINPEVFGLIGSILTTISFFPQTIKVIKTRDTKAISLLMYAMFNIGVLFWFIYGISLGNLPIIFANVITLPLVFTILVLKIINVKKGIDK